eukprot:Blabericola_migrator_1__2996@NODE_1869_length_3623_cov_21_772216_g1196_i0_p2_GENE_NODE_1869_length_3623_cov_21_772216_g1196_i0NODE_1869_length_3623_cov_21_772216_g1196_i0_p2_ORF_typecomplete_len463_score58_92_NODE_1869_length_3623_cov_21_772216_g1196_i021463534
MTRAIRLTSQSNVSVGDVITIGLVCVAGDDVRSSSVEWWRGNNPQQRSVPRQSRSESTPQLQCQVPKCRRPRDGMTGSEESSVGIRSSSTQGSTYCLSREGARRGAWTFASESSNFTPNWRNSHIDEKFRAISLYEGDSRDWLHTFQTETYKVPDFFQIAKDTSPDNVIEILRRRLVDVSGKCHELCADLLSAVEAQLTTEANFKKQEKSCESTEGEKDPAVQQTWNRLLLAVKAVLKDIRCRASESSMTADRGAAAPINDDPTPMEEAMRLINLPVSEEQFKLLCFLEPALTWLTLNADKCHLQHLMPNTMALVSLVHVRTALVRHHVLKRLSSLEFITDKGAAEYNAVLLGNIRTSSRAGHEPGAPGCLYHFVRLSSPQQIAAEFLRRVCVFKHHISLNIYFLIVVDIMGRGHSDCPLEWEDIVPLFKAHMHGSLRQYTTLAKDLASRLEPWLERLAKIN